MTSIGRERLSSLCTTIRNSELELMPYEINEKKVLGNVAELGVWKGDFARLINMLFPDRKLYLFDTFEGFNEKDAEFDKSSGYSNAISNLKAYAIPSTDIVLGKMLHPEQCIIKQSWFPSTAEGVEDVFSFVHLDSDLFEPTYAGLCFFILR